MPTVKLYGGLGNQMFQYAMGYSFARRISANSNNSSESLLFDTSWFERSNAEFVARNETPRTVALENLALGPIGRRRCSGSPNTGFLARLRRKVLGDRGSAYVPERQLFTIQRDAFTAKADCCLDGHWQHPAYSEAVLDALRQKFRPAGAMSPRLSELIAEFGGRDSIGIHVRLGDYVENSSVNAVHGTCTPAYYQKALKIARNSFPHAPVLLFTDDTEQARQRLDVADAIAVSDRGLEDYEEMELMKQMKALILSNSSFSWWGARLSEIQDSMIIGPLPWFDAYPASECLLLPNWFALDKSTGERLR